MTDAPKTCAACGSEVALSSLDTLRGTEGPVAIKVEGMPALLCANGHKRFVRPEFVAQLMDFASDTQAIAPQPSAIRRGLFKRHYHCSACEAELPAEPTGRHETVRKAAFEYTAPFDVIVNVAIHRCPQCNTEHVHSTDEVAKAAFSAIAHGFKAADIHVQQ